MHRYQQTNWLHLIIQHKRRAKSTACGSRYQIAFKAQQINSAAIYSDNSNSMKGQDRMTL